MNAIEIRDLTKKYKDTLVVDNLSLDIIEGELFSLLGINGAGKTTTIKMLCCLTAPTSGDATVLGSSITNSPDAVKAHLAVSPSIFVLFPTTICGRSSREPTVIRAFRETHHRNKKITDSQSTIRYFWRRRRDLRLGFAKENHRFSVRHSFNLVRHV